MARRMSRWNPHQAERLADARPVSEFAVSLNPPDVDLPTASIGEQPLRHRLHLRRLGKRHMLDAGAVPIGLFPSRGGGVIAWRRVRQRQCAWAALTEADASCDGSSDQLNSFIKPPQGVLCIF